MTSQQQAHQFNIDAAQREIDQRAADGEDMTGATIDPRTYAIIKPAAPRDWHLDRDDMLISDPQGRYVVQVITHDHNGKLIKECDEIAAVVLAALRAWKPAA